ncbi:MAG TPA: NAD(P)/FAD-dependent oxidoreductase, partial [Pyrinomonadaceae bacterium]|nr:NAD(P)/FAD-dependent oxidoreductase [Pyrinomonadaceae bacterium]
MFGDLYDCIVIGAGPAGLSASLFLARYLRRTLTFHHNSPRNEYAHGVHGFLGHHGIRPHELLARGRDEVTTHGGLIVEACVNGVERISPDCFRVLAGANGSEEQAFDARRLLLATGLRDLTPDCPGFREFYGSSVFHCPDCDGYEVRDKRVAVLSHGKKAAPFTANLMTWTSQLTLLTDGKEIPDEDRTRLAALGIATRTNTVVGLEGDTSTRQLQRVLFSDGEPFECDALFFNLGTAIGTNFHETLGCRMDDDSGLLWVDETQQTSVTGIYAAGDITPRSQLAVVAASEGAMAAIHIHRSLIPD